MANATQPEDNVELLAAALKTWLDSHKHKPRFAADSQRSAKSEPLIPSKRQSKAPNFYEPDFQPGKQPSRRSSSASVNVSSSKKPKLEQETPPKTSTSKQQPVAAASRLQQVQPAIATLLSASAAATTSSVLSLETAASSVFSQLTQLKQKFDDQEKEFIHHKQLRIEEQIQQEQLAQERQNRDDLLFLLVKQLLQSFSQPNK